MTESKLAELNILQAELKVIQKRQDTLKRADHNIKGARIVFSFDTRSGSEEIHIDASPDIQAKLFDMIFKENKELLSAKRLKFESL